MISYNKDIYFLIVDCETEGLNLRYSRPWQLSWLIADHKGIKDEQDRFIDIPDLSIPEHVKRMTHFDQEKYDRLKEPAAQILKDLNVHLYNPNCYIIGQNILKFDIFMISQLQLMAGEKINYSYLHRTLDTRALGKALKEGISKPKSQDEYIYWQYKLINKKNAVRSSYSLSKMATDLGVDYDPERHHDALYDIQLTFEVFNKLVKKLEL